MNKLYLMSLAALCLFSACKKEEDDDNNGGGGGGKTCQITKVKYTSGTFERTTNYIYNSDGNPLREEIEGTTDRTNYTYDGSTYMVTSILGGSTSSYSGSYDNVNKRAVTSTSSAGTQFISYNADGYITERMYMNSFGDNDTTRYTIVGGDVTQANFVSESGAKYTRTYDFLSTERVGPVFAGGNLFTGTLNKHLISKETTNYTAPTPFTSSTEYSYEFDSDGKVTKVTLTYSSGSVDVYENTFTCE